MTRPDGHAVNIDHRVVGLELARHHLIRSEDGQNPIHIGMGLEIQRGQHALITQGAQNRALAAGHIEGLEALGFDNAEKLVGVSLGRLFLEDDDHAHVPVGVL